MSTTEHTSLSRKQLQAIGAQLANDRKLNILTYAAAHEELTVSELKQDLDLPHSTAHEYCRELHEAGLLDRLQEKPATYAAVDFSIELSLDEVVSAVEEETQTLEYASQRYGDEILDEIMARWDEIEAGELTYREASASLKMDHADFLRVASELDLLNR
ncbi:helix-turn-helix domain-containing protein [Halonotius pteroides]|uniref:TrmB family transcriptional regulator n=1 Tax=Halonotius pteroides TaxID=268735 RepID=A0A3A6QEY0_9EURY|nr:helix-turn-helix domain-containing protein [Halonotius pteroides]RJX50313.1 TrmB family transcriptional regulator [Halonotius pteroides]